MSVATGTPHPAPAPLGAATARKSSTGATTPPTAAPTGSSARTVSGPSGWEVRASQEWDRGEFAHSGATAVAAMSRKPPSASEERRAEVVRARTDM